MARKSSTITEEAPVVTEATEAPATEATETEAPDLSAFEAAATEALTSGDQTNVVAEYAKLDRKGKAGATALVNRSMKSALVVDKNKDAAMAWVEIGQALKTKPVSEPKVREPKAPVNPTDATIERLGTLYLAYVIASQNLPEGVDADWSDRMQTLVGDAQSDPATAAAVAHKLDTSDDKGDAPESSELVTRALRLAFQGAGRKASSSTSNGPSYDGPRRSVAKHIEEAFAGHPSGTFLSVNDIRSFESSEYGTDNPSAGAVSAALKSGKSLPEGITGTKGGDKNTFGAVKA